MLISAGIKKVCEEKEVYWFLDIIRSYNIGDFGWVNDFQVWKLKKNSSENSCTIVCEDGDGNVIVRQKIPFTDYEGIDLKWWMQNETVYLPSEH